MATRTKIPPRSKRRVGSRTSRAFGRIPIPRSLPGRILLSIAVLVAVTGLSLFIWIYVKYDRMVDRRMSGQIFTNASKIYAAPRLVRVGDRLTAHDVASELRRAGYTSEGENSPVRMGSYRMLGDSIEIHPGAESYFAAQQGRIYFRGGQVSRIVVTRGDSRSDAAAYGLEPVLVTALFDSEQRSKRRLVQYAEIPRVLRDAVLAIEDRRFFEHGGVNYWRLAQAAFIDVWEGHRQQGGSTLTMQLSRRFFLTPEKTVKRKLTEILITFLLEHRFTKEQIFELYANEVYMGQRGSFAINGFGEAARSYFNKDLRSLNLPEAALLAGLIQRPSYLSPYKYPERAQARRNLVLDGMVETGAVTREEAERAKAAPLKLAPPNVEASDAPYFVDLVKDQLLERYSESDLNERAFRIYTTLDPELQRYAAEAVQQGLKEIDAELIKKRTRRVPVGKGKFETRVQPGPMPQVALVAMDAHTGAVLALVGGRNYGTSQLNHVVAKRPTGSVFKPFVYAAAINTAVTGQQPVVTAASLIDDSPTTFLYGDQIYEPRNYQEKYHGMVTARYALALSLNNATVRLAEQIGYDKVAELARAAGIKSVVGTPAAALGAYDATPLEMAGAYTVFSNQGVHVTPRLLNAVRTGTGEPVEEFQSERKPVLDPRVAYVMTNMMEVVINSGTAAGVRARGFSAPAAGKTGTSHDAWFAGYTSELLCIVWVGFDDYSDLRMSGGTTAAPIWAEFMKKAVLHPQYGRSRSFSPPTGIVGVQIDKATNLLATPACPDTYFATFIAGTEPQDTCEHGSGLKGLAQRLLGLDGHPTPPAVVSNPGTSPPAGAGSQPAGQTAASDGTVPAKKKSFLGRVVGIFKDEKKEARAAPGQPETPPSQGAGNRAPQ
ncbi:MAG TPA: PBP1A family penicillin-binding protein [Terriglobales bacterium]|nr:PBP1A family penicillin-binding protein [Terriglobales bacterium]